MADGWPDGVCGHCVGPKTGDHPRFCVQCIADYEEEEGPLERDVVEFTVEGVFTIRGRGPVISSKAGVPAGTFTPGGYAECGSLRALVKGVERNGSLRQRQHGILLDIAVEELAVGQVWRPVPEEGTCPV